MSAQNPPGGAASPTLLEQIVSDGFGIVRLSDIEAGHLADLFRESTEFFGADDSDKLRFSVPNRVAGYRPHAYAHAGSPDKPDLNDSFLYWKQRREAVPNHTEITPLLDAFELYRASAARIVNDLIRSMSEHYEYEHELPFEAASFMQVNSFALPTDSELLQQCHEDATFLTVIWASAEGLEGVLDSGLRPFTFAPDEVLVMPGSVMTQMTGGEIKPLYHQARNHGHLGRKSVMYFVSPDAQGPIEPFVANDYNSGADIRSLVISNPQIFGLSEDFVTA